MTAHPFEALADHMGAAYLRYSFTKGTEQEVDFLVDVLELGAGQRVLDVGCGPGRHAHALARRGVEVLGVDISERFIALAMADAPALATFRRADARSLDDTEEYDAVISLCQGAFGMPVAPGDDADVLNAMARALRPGGRLALSAFSAYFQVRYLEESVFDAATGVNHEHTVVRDETGSEAPHVLSTACFTPRELRLLAERSGLVVEAMWSVEPGVYERRPPDLDHPEFLMVARKPGGTLSRH